MDDVTIEGQDYTVDVATLPARLKALRLARRLSWPAFAKLLETSQTTLMKIVDGRTTKPHETTLHWLEARLAKLAAEQQQPTV